MTASQDKPSSTGKSYRAKMKTALKEAEARMYASETNPNFRFISKLLSARSPTPLSRVDLAPPSVVTTLSELGEFAEITNGLIDPVFAFTHREALGSEGFPLDGYGAIVDKDTSLVDTFVGSVGDLPGITVHRRRQSEIVVAFSGTFNVPLAAYDVLTNKRRFRHYPTSSSKKGKLFGTAHAGFYRVYKGVREKAFASLRKALEQTSGEGKNSDASKLTIAITGHSLGGAIAYLFFLDLIYNRLHGTPGDFLTIPQGTHFVIAAFGPPRVGNPTLVDHFHELVKQYRDLFGVESLMEYAVFGHRDGVPDLPPHSFGFKHFSSNRYYLYQGVLYTIPPSETEYTLFTVEVDPESAIKVAQREIIYLRGGHNYYNGRDMERLQRRLQGISADVAKGVEKWEERYLEREKLEEVKFAAKKERWKKIPFKRNSHYEEGSSSQVSSSTVSPTTTRRASEAGLA